FTYPGERKGEPGRWSAPSERSKDAQRDARVLDFPIGMLILLIRIPIHTVQPARSSQSRPRRRPKAARISSPGSKEKNSMRQPAHRGLRLDVAALTLLAAGIAPAAFAQGAPQAV